MTAWGEAVLAAGGLGTRLARRARSLHERSRYRLGLPAPEPGEAALAAGFRHPVVSDRRALLMARYRELFPLAVDAELAEARRLLAHRFAFLGHPMEHGEPIAWSRDPVSGGEWGRGFSADIAFRGPGRLGDIKLPWELNKHQYFFTLGKAAWLSGDPAPAIEIVRQMEHWMRDNPCQRGIHWISALETGTRAVSWVMAYPFYADGCDSSFKRRLAVSLAQHFLFVERHLSRGPHANTHLVGEAAALVVGGLFLDCRRSRRWVETGLAILEEELVRQTTPDGVHAERSVAYHRFFLDNYHLVNGLLASNGRPLPTAIARGMEKASDFLLDILFPDGSGPAFGDNDDARGLWFRADCPADYRSLLALGAVLFARGDFKRAAGGVTEEVLWLLGEAGIAKFAELPERPPDHASAAYPEGGYYVLRGGWEASDASLVFDCGPLGHGSAGHGHADALSVQLFAGGYPFLVDSGTFSYNLDYAWRDVFRSTRAHNTVVVDGQEQSVPRDRMSWETQAAARCHRWLTNPWFDIVEGEHDGYRRLVPPVTHRRVVVFLKPDTWVVWDHLAGEGRHEFEVFLHLRPDCTVDPRSGTGGVVLRSPAGSPLYVRSIGGGCEAVPLDCLVGSERERTAWFSPGYGTRVPSRTLRARRAFTGQASLAMCFSVTDMAESTLWLGDGSLRIGRRREPKREESLSVRMQKGESPGGEGIECDGEYLYRNSVAGAPPVLCTGGFRTLSVAGLLQVASPAPVESLVLAEDQCDVVLAPEHAGKVRVAAREGIRLAVNGHPAPLSGGVASMPELNS